MRDKENREAAIMLITDEDLFGPVAHQVDIFEAIAEAEAEAKLPTTNPTKEVPMAANFEAGDAVRYHGTVAIAHGVGHVERVYRNGRLDVRVMAPYIPAPRRPWGHLLLSVRPSSVTRHDAPDYGDELGVIDLFGSGQLALEVA
ncbi:hypothetical protein [Actinophytocola sediminis]